MGPERREELTLSHALRPRATRSKDTNHARSEVLELSSTLTPLAYALPMRVAWTAEGAGER